MPPFVYLRSQVKPLTDNCIKPVFRRTIIIKMIVIIILIIKIIITIIKIIITIIKIIIIRKK